MAIILNHKDQSWPIKGIVFDKDGTLLDFAFMWGTWSGLLLQILQEYAPVEVWEQAMGIKLHPYRYDLDGPHAMASNDQIESILAWQLYQKGYRWNKAISIIADAIAQTQLQMLSLKPARMMPGLAGLLLRCKELQLPLAVATSDDTSAAAAHLEWMGIDHYFGAVVGRDQVVRGKPFPEMAYLACSQLGLQPNEVVMFGDTMADIQMAKEAGMCAVIQIAEKDLWLPDADAHIQSFNELIVDTAKKDPRT